jgi:predicted ATPase
MGRFAQKCTYVCHFASCYSISRGRNVACPLDMGEAIKKLTIEGFKSIRKLEDLELRSLNVMIGANGAGKSNFVGFFRLLREIIDQKLQLAIATEGGADACVYLGPKVTQEIIAKLYFGMSLL